jgi:L-fuculose-phosphate aldolase
MDEHEKNVRLDMAQYCRRIYEKNLCVGGEGNISVRISDERILVTPTGTCLGDLASGDFVVIDIDGNPLDKNAPAQSSEAKMHLEVYKRRADINAIVHCHPRNALIYAVCHKELPWKTHPEVVAFLGEIPTIPYGRPSTVELAVRTASCLPDGYYAGLMENHGTITLGKDIKTAYWRTEVLDEFAYICCFSKLIGSPVPIPESDIALIRVT